MTEGEEERERREKTRREKTRKEKTRRDTGEGEMKEEKRGGGEETEEMKGDECMSVCVLYMCTVPLYVCGRLSYLRILLWVYYVNTPTHTHTHNTHS